MDKKDTEVDKVEEVAVAAAPDVPRRGITITTDGTVKGIRIEANSLTELEVRQLASLLATANFK